VIYISKNNWSFHYSSLSAM